MYGNRENAGTNIKGDFTQFTKLDETMETIEEIKIHVI